MTDQTPVMQTEVAGGRVVVRLSGEVDLANVDTLEVQLEDAIGDSPVAVLDLSAIEFIDSRGLRLLNRIAASVARRGGSLLVVAPPNSIARSVLDMTGLSQELGVRDAV